MQREHDAGTWQPVANQRQTLRADKAQMMKMDYMGLDGVEQVAEIVQRTAVDAMCQRERIEVADAQDIFVR